MRARELARLRNAARHAAEIGSNVMPGTGSTTPTSAPCGDRHLVELNIGHFLVGEAVAIGLPEAVRRMRELIDAGRRDLARPRDGPGVKIAVLGAAASAAISAPGRRPRQ